MADVNRMTIGALVDFCIDFNNRQKRAEREEKRGHRRKATQGDIDGFFG